MSSVLPFVINIVNTAFGVTVLAVPYCFHQCGLILGSILLVASSYASKKSCSLLLRSAQISRKRGFESLGFHVGGFLGKFIVEMSLIGYLVGTAIAWFVIIGDVSPAVVSSLFGIENTWSLRSFLIVALGMGIVLPLSLVKDITSLSSASNVAIGIYTMFVLQLFFSTLPKILAGDWMNEVNFWKPDGVLQCLPIYCISFLCQTVIFVLYEALPEPSVKKMEHVVNSAMDIVLLLSFTVGFSGYVMYFDDGIKGDLLNNYKHDFISEFIRLGFCISTILSFPLLVFPCRASINSLISSTKMNSEVTPAGGTYIPHDRFFMITCSLILGAVVCGVLFPNVEFVMALVGATMGAMLTYILPSYIFLKVADEDSPKTETKVLFVIGVCLFCLSTFSVLSISESQTKPLKVAPDVPVLNPPTMKVNQSFMKRTLEPQKIPELPAKNDKIFNKTTQAGKRSEDDEKRSVITEQKRLVVEKNTAQVIKESRKEPALPQEGVMKPVPDGARQPAEGAFKKQVDIKRQTDSTVGRSQSVVEQKLRRLPVPGGVKPSDNVLKREVGNTRKVQEHGLKEEVRIGERKILNDDVDSILDHLAKDKVAQDGAKTGTITPVTEAKSENNTSMTGQNESLKDDVSFLTTEKIGNKTRNGNVEEEPKPTGTKDDNTLINGSDPRKERVQISRKLQPPLLLRRKLPNSRIKLIARRTRDQPSDDREI